MARGRHCSKLDDLKQREGLDGSGAMLLALCQCVLCWEREGHEASATLGYTKVQDGVSSWNSVNTTSRTTL